jgi:hypothetical protein
MFLKNVSFGPPFEISIEFQQKSLKIVIFVEKKILGDFAKNCPLNPMSLPPPPSKFEISRVSIPWREVPCETLVITKTRF